MNLRPFVVASLGLAPLTSLALGPGDIAFTGFNADGSDDLAFVALAPIPENEVIYFTDDEWDGAALTSGEGIATWTAPAGGVAAGDIVTLNSLSTSATRSASVGAISVTGNLNLSGNNEAVFAYQGTDSATPSNFLAAIANDTVEATESDLNGTGLTLGVEANFIPGDSDFMVYSGARSGESNFGDYKLLVNDSFNWAFDDGSGDQSEDGTSPDLPFDTTPFVTGGVAPVNLFLSLNDSELTEGGATTTLIITRDGPTTAAASVELSSSDTSEATLPTTADFGIGDAEVEVTVTTQDDGIFDGTQLVTLTAKGAGFFDGTAELSVLDDFADSAELIVNEVYPNNFDLDLNGDGVASSDDEFIELVNTTGASLDVSGWTISDDTAVRHTFGEGTVLETDCAILIFDGLPATTTGINGTSAVAASSGGLALNSLDSVTVRNESDVVIMTSEYQSLFVAGVALDSVNLETETTPSAYIDHSAVTGSAGAQLSPGTKVDGSPFCTQPILILTASPDSFVEDIVGSASTGTITASPAPTSDLIVSLASADTSEAIVPESVTILANQPSATFPITTSNDLEVDGDIPVTLAASAPDYVGDTFVVTVQDDGDLPIAPNLGPGALAFTGFNSDGDDNFAFVVLQNIDEGQVIFFTDDEWDGGVIGSGGGFADSNEGSISWTAPVGGVAAGTVISIDKLISAASITANVGAVTVAAGSLNLSGSGDTLYAYQGADFRTVSSFLAAIATRTGDSIENTGLTAGTTAVYLDDNIDGAAYTGGRSNSASYAGYLAMIGNTAGNWTQTNDNGQDLLPFDVTPFTLGSGDTYSSWATLNGLTGANDGPEDDAENGGGGDGVANVLEFILDGDPLAVDPSILPVASFNEAGFIFVFNRSEDSIGVVTTTFQWSTDLAFPESNNVVIGSTSSPADSNGVTVDVDDATTPDTITVTVPSANAPDGVIFGRLMGTRP